MDRIIQINFLIQNLSIIRYFHPNIGYHYYFLKSTLVISSIFLPIFYNVRVATPPKQVVFGDNSPIKNSLAVVPLAKFLGGDAGTFCDVR